MRRVRPPHLRLREVGDVWSSNAELHVDYGGFARPSLRFVKHNCFSAVSAVEPFVAFTSVLHGPVVFLPRACESVIETSIVFSH